LELVKNFEKALKVVKEFGGDPRISTKFCKEWKINHKGCRGCPFEIDCKKVLLITKLLELKEIYLPKNFLDFLSIEGAIDQLQEKILKAKTKKALFEIFQALNSLKELEKFLFLFNFL